MLLPAEKVQVNAGGGEESRFWIGTGATESDDEVIFLSWLLPKSEEISDEIISKRYPVPAKAPLDAPVSRSGCLQEPIGSKSFFIFLVAI